MTYRPPRLEAKYRRRRIVAAVIAVILALVISAGVGVAVQKAIGWNQEDWAQHTSFKEPGVNSKMAEAVGVEEENPAADDIPVKQRTVDNPNPISDAPSPGSSTTIKISSAGLNRSYLISVPPDVQRVNSGDNKPLPLIMTYHGLNETPESIATYSGMGQSGAIVVYPLGVDKSWAGAPYAKTTKEQDQAFTRNVIDQVASTYQVDNNRIYAAGMSNGGGFVYELACDMPEMFQAVASVAGAYYKDTWTGCAGRQDASKQDIASSSMNFPRGQAVPLLEIHGRKDERIYYEGGERYSTKYLAAPQAVALYAQRSGCEAAPITTAATSLVMRTQWSNCEEGNEVLHLAIADAGHVWPGEIEKLSGSSALGSSSQDSSAITATREIIAFFKRHGLVENTW